MNDDLLDWVDAALAAVGRDRTGAPTVEADQPWGRVSRVPTSTGAVWLKAPAPGMRFELGVLTLLAGLEPAITPTVIATDVARGVVLLVDAGVTFSDAYDDATLPARFAAALVEVGRLQRSSVAIVADLLASGTPDLRPVAAAARFDEVVAATSDLPADVGAARPLLVAAADALASSAVPAAIDHNDLHDGNILLDGDGRVTVIDWGDSVVTHPFSVLLVAQRVLASLLGDVGWDHPLIVAARRDYLAVFADLAPGEDLERTARLAVVVAHLGRAWAWHRALASFTASGADAGRFADAAREWLVLGAQALYDAEEAWGTKSTP